VLARNDTTPDRLPADLALTDAEIGIVQHTFDLIVPISPVIADLFYERLFYLAPSVRRMVPNDMARRKRDLIVMLATTVQSLDNIEALIPLAKALGARHARHGVTAGHYAVAGEVLVWTLERGLASDFTAEAERAWRRAYGLIAAAMQAGAREVATLQAAE
jgi:nitric oxide dioxygenase